MKHYKFLNLYEKMQDKPIMNINNLYSFKDETLKCDNCLINIQEFDFYILYLCINCNNNKFVYYSDEWLYLINYNYPHFTYYNFFVEHYSKIVNQINDIDIIYYNNNVLSLITTFSRGSVHGYSGFYYTLIYFIENIELYKDLDIILYEECEYGMKQIINHLCKLGLIKNKIIYLKKNIKYKFKSVSFIENKNHVFNGELENKMTNFINQYILYKLINNNSNHSNYCILKTNKSENKINDDGNFEETIVKSFCDKHNFYRIQPNDEIDLINKIYGCKILILNYGSTFFKNYVYISESCEKIIVIINGKKYINDYNHLSNITPSKFQGIIHKKYKNANIHYMITNNSLDFDPFTL